MNQLVRKYSGGQPAKINSAFRNFIPKGGSKNSAHLRGNALDIGLNAEQKKELKANLADFLNDATAFGLKGFGVYNWGVHVDVDDVLPVENYWGYIPDGATAARWAGYIRHWGKEWLTPLYKDGETGAVYTTPIPPNEDKGHEDEAETTLSKILPFLLLAISIPLYLLYRNYQQKREG